MTHPQVFGQKFTPIRRFSAWKSHPFWPHIPNVTQYGSAPPPGPRVPFHISLYLSLAFAFLNTFMIGLRMPRAVIAICQCSEYALHIPTNPRFRKFKNYFKVVLNSLITGIKVWRLRYSGFSDLQKCLLDLFIMLNKSFLLRDHVIVNESWIGWLCYLMT